MKEHFHTKRQSFRDQNSVGYSQVNDEQLDSFLRDIVKNHPNAGERMIQGHLISLGCKVQTWRVRASLKRVDVNRSQRMFKFRIRRRIYNVPGSNALW